MALLSGIANITALTLLLLVTASCTSARISIHSHPENVQVWAHRVGGGPSQNLGNTPLTLKAADLMKRFDGDGVFEVELRKNGYRTDRIYITEISKVDVNIDKKLKPLLDATAIETLNTTVHHFMAVRRLVGIKKYNEALDLLVQLQKDYPQLAVVYELQGEIYVITGRYRDALDSYTLAHKYDPTNVTVIANLRTIMRILNIRSGPTYDELQRSPAAAGGEK